MFPLLFPMFHCGSKKHSIEELPNNAVCNPSAEINVAGVDIELTEYYKQ